MEDPLLDIVQSVFPNAVRAFWQENGNIEPPGTVFVRSLSTKKHKKYHYDTDYNLMFIIGFELAEDPKDPDEPSLCLDYWVTLVPKYRDGKRRFEIDLDRFSLDIMGWQTDGEPDPDPEAVRKLLIQLVRDRAPETPAARLIKKLKAYDIAGEMALCPRTT